MNQYVTVVCDRCGAEVEGFRTEYATGGFYDVRAGSGWASFASEGESNVCDACMIADPRYLAAYPAPTLCPDKRTDKDGNAWQCIRAIHPESEPCVWAPDTSK